uniref:Endonuclease/exonuclease/phosphatase domain-containing protein n=1 Tax=Acanthochromis polyacanthus TaxID=80966 RepID=A0A3Q1EPR8_9TELE
MESLPFFNRGVMILFRKNIEYTLHSFNKDNQGRWIVIEVTINNLHIIIANIYAPNEDSPEFFRELNICLNSIKVDQIIVTGDFNTILDINKDRRSLQKSNNHPQKAVAAMHCRWSALRIGRQCIHPVPACHSESLNQCGRFGLTMLFPFPGANCFLY